jgi:5'-nucleotidase
VYLHSSSSFLKPVLNKDTIIEQKRAKAALKFLYFRLYFMEILLTNDDGIQSEALLELARVLQPLGRVAVAAPLEEQSGKGHGFTYYKPLRFGVFEGCYPCEAHWVAGTPADSVKFGVCELYKDRRFDLVVSGINNGDNAGLAAWYSGTVAAAREAVFWGIPAIALSVGRLTEASLRFALDWIQKTVQAELFRQMPAGVLWNVNVPACESAPCAGLKIAAMGTAMFSETYQLEQDAEGHPEFRLVGERPSNLHREGTDDWWLSQDYATLTPLHIDPTNDSERARLERLFHV